MSFIHGEAGLQTHARCAFLVSLCVCVCGCMCVWLWLCVCSSVVSNCLSLWTVAHQASLSMEFFRQEYWSGLPCPFPGDLLDPGIEPGSPALQADYLLSHQGTNPLAEGTDCSLLMLNSKVYHCFPWCLFIHLLVMVEIREWDLEPDCCGVNPGCSACQLTLDKFTFSALVSSP